MAQLINEEERLDRRARSPRIHTLLSRSDWLHAHATSATREVGGTWPDCVWRTNETARPRNWAGIQSPSFGRSREISHDRSIHSRTERLRPTPDSLRSHADERSAAQAATPAHPAAVP